MQGNELNANKRRYYLGGGQGPWNWQQPKTIKCGVGKVLGKQTLLNRQGGEVLYMGQISLSGNLETGC